MNVKLYFISLFFLLSACDRDPVILPPSDFKLAYYPLEIGKYWTYAVDSVVYNPIVGGVEQDSVRLYVKEEVIDTFRDDTGVLLYRVDRFERYADSLPWELIQVIAMGIQDERSAIRLESNLRFSKLVFPPSQGKRWEGNSDFDMDREYAVAGERVQIFRNLFFFIESLDEPYELPGFAFDSVATVLATNFPETCSLQYREFKEKYAKNVGLVFREWVVLDEDFDNVFDTCVIAPWRDKAEAGFVIRQTLIDHN